MNTSLPFRQLLGATATGGRSRNFSNLGGHPQKQIPNIIINANGSRPTRLTRNRGDDLYATWSRDGKQIAFVSQRDRNFEIYVMNADGSNQKRITTNGPSDFSSSWSRP